MKIREANIQDVEGIAYVHLNSWRTTYKGLISESVLSKITLETRKKSWLWTFNHLNQDEKIFIAEDSEGEIVGFSNSGKNRNSEYHHEGELYAIYLLKEYHGQGIGKRLFEAAVGSLKTKGYNSMMLWVLDNNPTIGFYQRFGGSLIGEKEITIGDRNLVEFAIGWESILQVTVIGK